ncbi:MAG TPA: hypothetical protein VJI75_04320 [Candidatus Nanoarchaeia archaeon]|nr:hypothetical protein [Candidatus Nanoarchaeia archaeon]
MADTASLILNGEIDVGWLERAVKSPIYCADGAFNKVFGTGLEVKAIIGDMDSVNKSLKTGANMIRTPDQDYT